MIKAVNAIHTFTSRKTKLVVTRCPLGVSAPWIEIDAMIVNFGIIEQKNGCSLPVDYHHKGCGRINAPHGVKQPLYYMYSVLTSIKNACKLAGFRLPLCMIVAANIPTFSELPKKKRLFSPKEGQISIDYCKTSAIFCFASDNFSIITGKSSSFKNLAERDV